MRVTLEIKDDTVCAFIHAVRRVGGEFSMETYPLTEFELKSGGLIYLVSNEAQHTTGTWLTLRAVQKEEKK